jgi:CRP-like cAMP-binding protein
LIQEHSTRTGTTSVVDRTVELKSWVEALGADLRLLGNASGNEPRALLGCGSVHSAALVTNLIGGQRVRNKILLALPKNEHDAVFRKLEFVSLPSGAVLTVKDAPIKFAYFVNAGLVSVLTVMANNKTAEVGLCGREGFVGLPLTVGFTTSSSQVLMQVSGSAFRMSAEDFVVALRQCPSLAIALLRFTQEMGLQAAQLAACNRLHDVDQRLARWLLMSQDRLGGDSISLTQDAFAGILGTRRATVSAGAGILKKAGIITYASGELTIKDRPLLEKAACECYGVMMQRIKKWHAEAR